MRRNTKPIPAASAATWKKRLAITYAVLAWNSFALVMYLVFKGKGDWAQHFGLKSKEELEMTPGNSYHTPKMSSVVSKPDKAICKRV